MPSTRNSNSRTTQAKRSPTKVVQAKGVPAAKAPPRAAATSTKPKPKPVAAAKPKGARQVPQVKQRRHKPAKAAPAVPAVTEVNAIPQMQSLASQMDAALHDPSVASVHLEANIQLNVVRNSDFDVPPQEVKTESKLADRVENVETATVVEHVHVTEKLVPYPVRSDRRGLDRPKAKVVQSPEEAAASLPTGGWLERILHDNMARGGDRRKL